MNKGISKWPSRALNLLVVLAMVISLSALIVAPSVSAQECNPTPVYNGCHLDVAVKTYIKNTAGDFIPQTSFGSGECFYVNAVVVNTGETTAVGPITATISFPQGHVELAGVYHGNSLEDTQYTKTWPNGDLTYASPEGLMADFWWEVCCEGPYGYDSIMVTASSTSQCNQPLPAQACTTVYQGTSTVDNCLHIEIVEAPGMPDKVGQLGNYEMSMPNPVAPCQNFGIKAEFTNECSYVLHEVVATIGWTGPASIVGDDPLQWTIGDLAPGETKGVGWTLHCDDPGDVVVTVSSPTSNHKVDDPWTVHQEGGYGLMVTITKPFCIPDCNRDCEIVQPSGDCGAEDFVVEAVLHNSGESPLVLVYAVISATPEEDWVQLPSPMIKGPYTIVGGGNQVVQFNVTCIGNGTGDIKVEGTGADSVTGASVNAEDSVTIKQTYLTAEPSPDPAYAIPAEVNRCQTFPVTFRYMNYSGNAWNDPATGNVTACIHWDQLPGTFTDSCGSSVAREGNATLIGSVYYRRVVGGFPEGWQLLQANPIVTGNDSVGYTSCAHIPVVCDCCGVEVRWTFQCTEVGPVIFDSWITVEQEKTSPPTFSFYDTAQSRSVCVNQVWKAHLVADSFFFVQTDAGQMIMQDAVVPGTQFHVVIPVINTGDADAENVDVYFILTDAPQGCAQSFRIVSTGNYGDATSIVAQGGGAYIAHFPVIPAHGAMKATMTIECLCEGDVSVWVPDAVAAWGGQKGVRAFDENTGLAVPQDNIVVPPCPREMEQIPFTVEIINPHTCDTFNEGQTFPVKAQITNGATTDLEDVYATLTWGLDDNVALVGNQTLNADTHSCTKYVGNITAGSFTEITWEMLCTGDSHDNGEVWFGVSASSTYPALTAFTVEYPYTVNVHQIGIPGADIRVEILSPDEHQFGQDWDKSHEHAMIATGQQFAVTAKVWNDSGDPANVQVCISDCDAPCGYFHYVTLLDAEGYSRDLGVMYAGDFQVVTWTFTGGADHDWDFDQCDPVHTCLEVYAWPNVPEKNTENNDDDVWVSIYPAAFLQAEITCNPTPTLGEQFSVCYKITNLGVADATTVVPTLSVSPAGVAVISATPDYTPQTIAGWSWGEPYNYIEGTFTLTALSDVPFTVSIGPTGEDECGWHPELGEWCEGDFEDWECEPQYNWIQMWGMPIQSRFLRPDAITLQADVPAPPVCEEVTTMDISLAQGWNLVSLPLMPDDGDVADICSGLDVESIWEYNNGAGWVTPTALVDGKGYWVYMNTAGTMTVDGQVNPMPPQTPPTYTVLAGWNLVGFKSCCPTTAGAYLFGVPYVRIWGFADGQWVPCQSGSMLQPGLGYWVAASGTGTIFP